MQISCVDTFSTERHSLTGMIKQNWVSFAQTGKEKVAFALLAPFSR